MPHWRIKASVQNLVARLPHAEHLNDVLQTVRSGLHLGTTGAVEEVRRRLPSVSRSIGRLAADRRLEGADVVEVGTGWVPLPTILLFLCGTRRIRTYDIARHVRFSRLQGLLAVLRQEVAFCAASLGLPRGVVADRLARLEPAGSAEEAFSLANIDYVAPGDAAATKLPGQSTDLFYSYTVLEYMPLPVLHAVCREARRILKPGAGRFYACVGCASDYAGFDRRLSAMHYLSYSDIQWGRIATNKLQFVNRMREPEFLEVFAAHGATVERLDRVLRSEEIEQVKNMKLANRFARFTPEQNAVRMFAVLLSFR